MRNRNGQALPETAATRRAASGSSIRGERVVPGKNPRPAGGHSREPRPRRRDGRDFTIYAVAGRCDLPEEGGRRTYFHVSLVSLSLIVMRHQFHVF